MVGTALEPLAPVMDSVVVLLLCSLAILSYFRAFRRGIAQLAGFPASAKDQLAVRHALKRAIKDADGRIVDVALVRFGRKLDAVVYYDPKCPITAEELDALTTRMDQQLHRDVGPAAVLVVASRFGRRVPADQVSDKHK